MVTGSQCLQKGGKLRANSNLQHHSRLQH